MSDSNAWLGSLELKEEILRDLAEDLERERYVQGTYLAHAEDNDQAFYGCHVGCLMMARARYDNRRSEHPAGALAELMPGLQEVSSTWHHEVPDKLGMPRALAEFWDKTFEKMPAELAPRFAIESLQCVPVGGDLRNVLPRLIVWLLDDPQAGFLAGAPDPHTTAEGQIGAYLVVAGELWKTRAQDYTVPAQTGINLTENITAAVGHVESDAASPYYWASLALGSAISGAATQHVAGALLDEWAEALENGAIAFPEPRDHFDNTPGSGDPLWFVAQKFFELCATSPQGNPA